MAKLTGKQLKEELQIASAQFFKIVNTIAAQGLVCESEEEYNASENELHKEYVRIRDYNEELLAERKSRKTKK